MDNLLSSSCEQLYRLNLLTPYMAGHKGFIAGGCFKNLFNNERIKDIDVFFEKEAYFHEAVKHFEAGEDYNKYYENPKVVAFINSKTKVIVELIRKTYGTPKEILFKFDFSITKFAYYKEQKEDSISYVALYHDKFFEHLHTKKLVLNKEIFFPMSTFERSLKYTKYGYGLCRESKQNLINAIRNTPTPDDLSKSMYDGLD
jgi:hypothetical protein